MATCPNKTLQSWKDLVNSRGEDMAYYLWDKYEGNIPESEYAETAQVKPGVSELFDSNPELANAVYEALGFNNSTNKIATNKIVSINNTNFGDETPNSENELSFNLKDIQVEEFNDIVRGNKATVYFSVPINKTISFGERANNTIAQMMLHKDGNIVTISSVAIYSPSVRIGENQLKVNEGKGIGKYIYELLGDKLLNEQSLILKSDASMSIGAQKVWEYLVKNNKAEKAQDGRYYYKNNQITPQQKQQALQQYSQYLDTIFPDSQVKDIVYHVNKTGIISPEDSRKFYSTSFGSWLEELEEMKGNRIPIILNITNPTTVDSYYEFSDQAKKFRESGLGDEFITPDEVREPGTDSVIGRDSGQGGNEKTYVTYSSNQVYQLGSKQDIEGFKEFVKSPQARITSPETDELSLYLSNKMNENFKISTPELKGAPSIDAIVTNHVPVNQTDIDTKKEEC